MTIQIGNKQYLDFQNYLKQEQPKFYKKQRKHYFEKKGAFPEMTEHQYLIHIIEKMGKRARAKIEKLDGSLIKKEDLEKLTKLLRKNPKSNTAMKKYADIDTASRYLTLSDKETLNRKAVNEIYDKMDEKDRRTYGKTRLSVMIPKLNLGPWRQHGRGNPSDIEKIIERNKEIFKAHEDIVLRLFERAYDKELQSEKTTISYRKKLKKI